MIGDTLAILLAIVVAVVGLLSFGAPIQSSVRPRPFWPTVLLFCIGFVSFSLAYFIYLYR